MAPEPPCTAPGPRGVSASRTVAFCSASAPIRSSTNPRPAPSAPRALLHARSADGRESGGDATRGSCRGRCVSTQSYAVACAAWWRGGAIGARCARRRALRSGGAACGTLWRAARAQLLREAAARARPGTRDNRLASPSSQTPADRAAVVAHRRLALLLREDADQGGGWGWCAGRALIARSAPC
eukprot:3827277-Prymnesium_polylepis.2